MQEDNKKNSQIENKEEDIEQKGDSKESKEEPKDGIEILKEIGLKNVSNKTFINLENLTYLLDKDFEKLHKTKALGFIQILERDFKVDLSNLKDEYLNFQNRGRRANRKRALSKESQTEKREYRKDTTLNSKKELKKRLISDDSNIKIGPYILIALALILGYYLFNNATKDEHQLDVLDLNVVQNEPIVNEAKENLLAVESEENSSNTTLASEDEDIDLNKVVHEMFKKADINDTQLEMTQEQDIALNDINTSKELSKQDTNSSQELAKLQQKTQESNSSNITNITNNSLTPLKAEQQEQTNKKRDEIKEDKKSIKTKKPTLAGDELYIVPIKKAWVGVIYLDNYTKKDFLIRKKLKLDPNRDQIILVGHRNFKIYSHGERESFTSKKMVRFIYEGGNLREISKKEYQKRSAGVRW